jgi:hypothetical protein
MTTNEELLAAFAELKKDMKEEFKDIKSNYVPLAVYQTVIDGINNRLSAVEGSIAKVAWLVVAGVVGALLSIVIHPEFLTIGAK